MLSSTSTWKSDRLTAGRRRAAALVKGYPEKRAEQRHIQVQDEARYFTFFSNMEKAGYTSLHQLAVACGLKTPNTFYNFRARRSRKLSLALAARVAELIGGSALIYAGLESVQLDADGLEMLKDVAESWGADTSSLWRSKREEQQPEAEPHHTITLEVTMKVAAEMQRQAKLPAEERRPCPLQVTRLEASMGMFGVLVADRSAEPIYARGTTLICAGYQHIKQLDGRRVVVRRVVRRQGVHISLCQVRVLDARSAVLVPAGNAPSRGYSIPWPYRGRFTRGSSTLTIAGVVIASFAWEGV